MNENNVDGQGAADAAQMLAMQTQLLQNLAQVVANHQNAPPPPPPQPQSGIRKILSTQPPTFSQAVEPLEADDWLRVIESKLQIARSAENEKVLFISHQLVRPATERWIAFTATHPNP